MILMHVVRKLYGTYDVSDLQFVRYPSIANSTAAGENSICLVIDPSTNISGLEFFRYPIANSKFCLSRCFGLEIMRYHTVATLPTYNRPDSQALAILPICASVVSVRVGMFYK